jgi:hypothetical protein
MYRTVGRRVSAFTGRPASVQDGIYSLNCLGSQKNSVGAVGVIVVAGKGALEGAPGEATLQPQNRGPSQHNDNECGQDHWKIETTTCVGNRPSTSSCGTDCLVRRLEGTLWSGDAEFSPNAFSTRLLRLTSLLETYLFDIRPIRFLYSTCSRCSSTLPYTTYIHPL